MTEEDIKTGTVEGEQPAQTPEQAANDLTRPTNANIRWYSSNERPQGTTWSSANMVRRLLQRPRTRETGSASARLVLLRVRLQDLDDELKAMVVVVQENDVEGRDAPRLDFLLLQGLRGGHTPQNTCARELGNRNLSAQPRCNFRTQKTGLAGADVRAGIALQQHARRPAHLD